MGLSFVIKQVKDKIVEALRRKLDPCQSFVEKLLFVAVHLSGEVKWYKINFLSFILKYLDIKEHITVFSFYVRRIQYTYRIYSRCMFNADRRHEFPRKTCLSVYG